MASPDRQPALSGLVSRTLAACTGGFAVCMFLSGALKAVEPGPAALFLIDLSRGAWSMSTWQPAVVAASLLQASVGVALLAQPSRGWIRGCGIALVLVLLAVELASAVAGVGRDCGCYGAVPVPRGLTASILGAGLVGLVFARPGAPAVIPTAARHHVCAVLSLAVLASGGVGVARLVRHDAEGPTIGSILAEIAWSRRGRDTLVIVGSRSCDHCCELLDRQRSALVQLSGKVRVVLVVSRDDAARGCADRHLDWLELVPIADDSWWPLVPSRPPVIYRVAASDGSVLHVRGEDGLRALLRAWRQS